MERETIRQIRLGFFVVAGIILLVISMYMIGRNHDLFVPTLKVKALFNNVNGLQPGNNVRFAGADAGTVESVNVISDTAVLVEIVLEQKFRTYIRCDALASVGTDGLMGNKIVNIINNGNSNSELIREGCIINTLKPVETDEMLRTLNQTNEYVSGIAVNLKNITDEIGNSRGTLWRLLTDTLLAARLYATFGELQQASHHTANLLKKMDYMMDDVNHGKGALGALVADSSLHNKVVDLVNSLNKAGSQTNMFSTQLLGMAKDINNGKGTLGVLIKDSLMAGDLKSSVSSLKQSSDGLSQSIDALKKIPFLKKYLKTK